LGSFKQGSGSFLKKRTKKTSSIGVPAVGHPMDEKFFASFCSQKEDA
jgi:hypothetical protein